MVDAKKPPRKNFSPEAKRLLIGILFGTATLDELEKMDPTEMAVLAVFARVEAHLLWRLGQLQADAEKPSPFVQKLQGFLKVRCLQNAAQNLRMDTMAREACRQMAAAGIKVMLIKGSALRARYPELAGRPQGDTDILVPAQDVEKAEAVLVADGYIVDEKEFTREEYLTQHFDLRMIKNGIPLEIHWTMSNRCAEGAVERTWARAEQINWQGVPVWVPGLEDGVVFTQIHMCRHYFDRSLKWYGDLLLELEKWPGLDERLEEVRRDWPPRMVYAPVKVGADWGRAADSGAVAYLEKMGGLDGRLLSWYAGSAFFDDTYWGLRQWRFSGAVLQWIYEDSSSLAGHFVRGFWKQFRDKAKLSS
jgi:hypothetical protein|nr:nucleotidyltransferase family protein [Candidatus Krumholzibacteria bacterium]